MSLPYFAIGNDELAQLPAIGKTIMCPTCGKDHVVKNSRKLNKDTGEWEECKDSLQFYTCGEKHYLCGIAGRKLP